MYKKSFFLQSIFSLTALSAQDQIHFLDPQVIATQGDFHSPIVFVNQSGSSIAFFNDDKGATYNILYSILLQNNSSWTTPQQLVTGVKKEASYVNTTMNSSGDGIIVLNTEGPNLASYRFHLDAQEVVFSDQITSSTQIDTYDPAVGIDESGNILCAWKDATSTSHGANIYAATLFKNSSTWSDKVLVANPTDNTRTCNVARVAMNQAGNGVILWNDWINNSSYGQYYSKRISLKSGTFFLSDTIMKLPSDTIDNKKQEDDVGCGVDALGNVIVAWRYA